MLAENWTQGRAGLGLGLGGVGGARSLIYGYAAPTRTTSAFACHVREEFVLKSFLVSIGLI